MKRIHLFEFEDFDWIPNWLRKCLTRMMDVMHKLLDTSEEMAELVERDIKDTSNSTIIDLCSWCGGPMPEVARKIPANSIKQKQPFLSFEISDNSFPKAVLWIAIPINIITSYIVSLLTRPMTIQQIIFT